MHGFDSTHCKGAEEDHVHSESETAGEKKDALALQGPGGQQEHGTGREDNAEGNGQQRAGENEEHAGKPLKNPGGVDKSKAWTKKNLQPPEHPAPCLEEPDEGDGPQSSSAAGAAAVRGAGPFGRLEPCLKKNEKTKGSGPRCCFDTQV